MLILAGGSDRGVTPADFDRALEESGVEPTEVMPLSGSARAWARGRGLPLREPPPLRVLGLGQAAPPYRNEQACQRVQAEGGACVVAWNGRDSQTRSLLASARRWHLAVYAVEVRPEPAPPKAVTCPNCSKRFRPEATEEDRGDGE